MKKNVKYLGAAAAALLAVAPVVASTTVANAAQVVSFEGNNNGEVQANHITASLTIPNANSIAANTNADTLTANLAASLDNGSAVTVSTSQKAQIIDANTNKPVNKVVAGGTYYAQVSGVVFKGLNSKIKYQVSGVTTPVDNQAVNAAGNLVGSDQKGFTVRSAQFTVLNTGITGNPYFVVDSQVSQNATINNAPTNLNTLYDEIQKAAAGYKSGSESNRPVSHTTKAQVKSALESAAGIKVNKDGSFATPSASVVVPYTINFLNGKSATLNVTLNFTNADTAAVSPKFNPDGKYVVNNNWVQPVKVGASFNAAEVANAVKAQISPTDATGVNVAVKSSNVNTAVAGTYQVVLTATNPAGYTNTYTVNVHVGEKGQVTRTVNYVKGYSVVAWNINGNHPSISTTKFAAGSTVTTEGTPITVAGVQYYKIAGQNLYIQAQYVDGSWKPSKPSTSTSTSKEEKMSGVIVVKYNGRGQVRLLDGNGKYTDNYVANNAAFKVFAKKTINGKTYYRLGTQSQWIPAQYAMFR